LEDGEDWRGEWRMTGEEGLEGERMVEETTREAEWEVVREEICRSGKRENTLMEEWPGQSGRLVGERERHP
jgi:hypothetical protein